MKKRFCLIGIIVALIVAGVALASCSNLIEDLKGKNTGDFVKINGGTYDGSAPLTPSSSVFKTGRTVTISDFYICDHEVTQAEYEKYCTYGGSSPSDTYGKGPNHPAYYVSWYDALVYCNRRSIAEGLTPCYTINGKTSPDEWGTVPTSSDETWNAATCDFNANGYRLPTEAEWEYCARSENRDSYNYSGSNTVGDVAWYYDNSYALGSSSPDYGTHDVKTKAPNSKGLYDMSGNVWEWCWDWYGTIGNDTPSVGPSSGDSRVERGGCWGNFSDYCRVASRDYGSPNYRYSYFIGFRVVRSAN
ncbi:MAG: formylglycine-generating enzyme family protein [Treponema sp.]|nr:formylglycine-generating enzyme family protein [Treponema sp.]